MVITVIATAYNSSPGQTDASPTITASGQVTAPGTMAANFLPLGTVVEIAGATYTVSDRMNSRYNGYAIIDIWFSFEDQSDIFGVQEVELKVVSLPDRAEN